MTYTDEKNAQIVLSLLKANNIKKIVASPGTTNMPITVSVKRDPFFEVYSSVDERSAAYMACGLSLESNEPVVLSCTGATASRNYLPGLTEAYYKKLPIISITSFNGNENVGHLVAQNIDRRSLPNDVVKCSVQLPYVNNDNDFWECKTLVNKALIETVKDGGGPVHINLPCSYKGTFTTETLPEIRNIKYIDDIGKFNISLQSKKICIFLGSNKFISEKETELIDKFCEMYDGVVLCDHTSEYKGKYRINAAIATSNASPSHKIFRRLRPDLVIHIGEVSGEYYTTGFLKNTNSPVWRISNDGELRDTFKNLDTLFDLSISTFFSHFCSLPISNNKSTYFNTWVNHKKNMNRKLEEKISDIEFSNIYIASVFSRIVPKNSTVQFGILNTLRSNNFYDYDNSISTTANVGGFGIDGCLSTLLGSALANPKKLNFGLIGDLAFFYDMNSLGNRHLPNNMRILLINNGMGTEFKNYTHQGASLGEEADDLIAAAKHFRAYDRNESLAKAWCQALGIEYLKASTKEEFDSNVKKFVENDITTPIIFECFTNSENESNALKAANSLNDNFHLKGKMKNMVKDNFSNTTKNKIRKLF